MTTVVLLICLLGVFTTYDSHAALRVSALASCCEIIGLPLRPYLGTSRVPSANVCAGSPGLDDTKRRDASTARVHALTRSRSHAQALTLSRAHAPARTRARALTLMLTLASAHVHARSRARAHEHAHTLAHA